jgi:hypothetical protein
MQVGPVGMDLFNKFDKKGEIHLGMNTAYDMYFRDGLPVISFYDVQHLIDTQFPSLFFFGIEPGVGAEFAGKHADIRGLDMEIAVEIGFVAVQAFSDKIGQGTCKSGTGFFKQNQAILITDAFTGFHLGPYGFQGGA